MSFLSGKRILIVGLASNRSIAWGIAQAMHKQGAELAFSYQNDKLKSRVEEMAGKVDSTIVLSCDVSSDEQIDHMYAQLKSAWAEGFDGIVHAVAFAPKEALAGNFLDGITRENFAVAHDISAYSLTALVKAGRAMLRPNSSVMTLSYLGAVRTVPNYNVMGLAKASLEANVRYLAGALGAEGIRVNGISAGPIRTLAASGISGFRKMLEAFEQAAPLKRCITIEEVGNVAAFMCSDLASGVTGEITYVDCGFSTVVAGL